jgi:hypothetical protein
MFCRNKPPPDERFCWNEVRCLSRTGALVWAGAWVRDYESVIQYGGRQGAGSAELGGTFREALCKNEEHTRPTMKAKEVIKRNTAIALFNGAHWTTATGKRKLWFPRPDPTLIEGTSLLTPADLMYHESWRWLMPALEKIEKVGYETKIQFCYNPYVKRKDKMQYWCDIDDRTFWGKSLKSKIEAVWIAVSNFYLEKAKELKYKL